MIIILLIYLSSLLFGLYSVEQDFIKTIKSNKYTNLTIICYIFIIIPLITFFTVLLKISEILDVALENIMNFIMIINEKITKERK